MKAAFRINKKSLATGHRQALRECEIKETFSSQITTNTNTTVSVLYALIIAFDLTIVNSYAFYVKFRIADQVNGGIRISSSSKPDSEKSL